VQPAGARSKPGFDCASAGSALERLICSDEGLARQDRELTARSIALSHSLTQGGGAVLRAGQLKWLASRKQYMAEDTPHDQCVLCLSSAYTERTADLNAQYKTVGGLSIEDRDSNRHPPAIAGL
jgi:uncharacterized protein